MIYIEAVSNGEKCELKKGSFIEIGFPYKKQKYGMRLFYGKWKDGRIIL